jgi:hypothetical protein
MYLGVEVEPKGFEPFPPDCKTGVPNQRSLRPLSHDLDNQIVTATIVNHLFNLMSVDQLAGVILGICQASRMVNGEPHALESLLSKLLNSLTAALALRLFLSGAHLTHYMVARLSRLAGAVGIEPTTTWFKAKERMPAPNTPQCKPTQRVELCSPLYKSGASASYA